MAKSKRRKGAVHQRVPPKAKPTVELSESLKEFMAAVDLSHQRVQPRLLSLLFCDFCNNTNDSKVNLIGIFDRVLVHPENRMSLPFYVYARTAETFDDPLWLRIFGPENEPVAELKFDPITQDQIPEGRDPSLPKQVQFMLPMALKFQKPGNYWFDVAFRNRSLGGAALPVKFIDVGDKNSGTDTFV